MPRHAVVFPTPEAVSRALAVRTIDALSAALNNEPRVTLCLTGGSTPEPAYRLLARADLDWDRIHLFWTDERCVAPDDPRSNYGMAARALIGPVGISDSNVHRFEGERGGNGAAAEMERELEVFFGADGVRFDVLHLGMGPDGHIASLFPDRPSLDETERRAVSTVAPATMDVPDRVTLTFPVLDAAQLTLLAATGAGKRDALTAVWSGSGEPRLPAARLAPAGDLVWLVDDALGREIVDGG